jgi:hypothetical protein
MVRLHRYYMISDDPRLTDVLASSQIRTGVWSLKRYFIAGLTIGTEKG